MKMPRDLDASVLINALARLGYAVVRPRGNCNAQRRPNSNMRLALCNYGNARERHERYWLRVERNRNGAGKQPQKSPNPLTALLAGVEPV